MKSTIGGQSHFSTIPKVTIPRSSFDRSHGHKTTFQAGILNPIYVDEALPGDTFHLKMSALARLATPIFPIMDNIFMDTHFFSVPVRLVWDNWKRFNGEQDNPGDSTDFLVPQCVSPSVDGYGYGSLFDMMGIPPGVPNLTHSALPLRAVNLIFNEWFRDENLIDSLEVPKDDGPDDSSVTGIYQLRRRGKRSDYFTSCLPFPQKGAAVQIPLGTSAPVSGALNYTVNAAGSYQMVTQVDTSVQINHGGQVGGVGLAAGLFADLSAATGATINALRQSFQLRRLLELDARGGRR